MSQFGKSWELKMQKLEYFGSRTLLLNKIKKFLSVPHMKRFEKLSFYSGGNL